MPDLLIRNVSTSTLAALKDRARSRQRSVQAEALDLLERAVAPTAGMSLINWAKTIRDPGIDVKAGLKAIRASRDER